MEAYQVILLIAVLVAFFYVSIGVYVLGQMREFRARLRKRLRAINMLLSDAAGVVEELVGRLEREHAQLTEAEEETFRRLRALTFNSEDEPLVRSRIIVAKEAISTIRMAYASRKDGELDELSKNDLDLLSDLERNFRSSCALYNADVVAYNYWIKVPTFHWLGYIFGHRKRASIS